MLRLNHTTNIWFTSDLHINHKNIVYGVSSWDNKEVSCRKFDTIEEMNSTIIDNINKLVMKDDYLVILGDLMMGIKDYDELFDSIVCKNLIIVKGNHDVITLDRICDERGLLCVDYLELIIGDIFVVLSHYPLFSWNKGKDAKRVKRSIHLFGHVHSSFNLATEETNSMAYNYNKNFQSLDVGVDSAYTLLGEYRPFNFVSDILPIIDTKNNLKVDYH